MIISCLKAREVLDSRGNPTLEVVCILEDGTRGSAKVPSGVSKGTHEAVELRDGNRRYKGRGVEKAVSNVNGPIAKAIVGMSASDQSKIDERLINLDGTPQKRKLGANAILGTSMAVMKASANYLSVPLYRYIGGMVANVMPVPLMNFINGGRHARNELDIQEFMVVPHGAPSFKEALRFGVETYMSLKEILEESGLSTSLGDEGGFSPEIQKTEEALDFLMKAIEKAGYKPGEHISLAIDVAATELFKDGRYHIDGKEMEKEELVEFYERLIKKYPIISIEDGMAEDDWEGWVLLSKKMEGKVQLVADDLFVTSPQRIRRGVKEGVANSVLIKPNQIGTMSEVFHAVREATLNGYTTIISHRSGETEDTTISDLSVGLCTGLIKTGSVARSERVSKYNRLLEIEEELGSGAVFLGRKAFNPR